MLGAGETVSNLGGQSGGQNQPDRAVQFINSAKGLDPEAVLVDAGPIAKTGGALIAGAGGNF